MVFPSYSWNNGGLKKKRKEKNGRDAAVLRAATTIHPPFKVCRMSQSISGSCNTTLSLLSRSSSRIGGRPRGTLTKSIRSVHTHTPDDDDQPSQSRLISRPSLSLSFTFGENGRERQRRTRRCRRRLFPARCQENTRRSQSPRLLLDAMQGLGGGTLSHISYFTNVHTGV